MKVYSQKSLFEKKPLQTTLKYHVKQAQKHIERLIDWDN